MNSPDSTNQFRRARSEQQAHDEDFKKAAPLPQPTAPPETEKLCITESAASVSAVVMPHPFDLHYCPNVQGAHLPIEGCVAQTIEAEQLAFEAWADKHSSFLFERDPAGGYLHLETQFAWMGWKGSAHQKAELTQTLRNLLAVVHRDGGHYAAEHGLDKASLDAEKVVIQTRAELASLREECERMKRGK
jgi:hypothetical protein